MARLFYRFNNSNKTITGANRISSNKEKGLCLCWQTLNQRPIAKMLHRGNAHACSNIFIYHNGVEYQVLSNTTNDTNCVYDDCGGKFTTGTGVSAHQTDGFYFGNGIAKGDASFSLNSRSPFTIHFKVKGTSSTASSRLPAHILHLSTDVSNWTPKLSKNHSQVLAFGMTSDGRIMFADHTQESFVSGSKTAWRDYKITFYPRNYTSYNDKLKMNVYVVDFDVYHNGAYSSGTTGFVLHSSYWYLALSKAAMSWSQGVSDRSVIFNGYFKFLSISQDTEGYSTYRRPTHKILMHFD